MASPLNTLRTDVVRVIDLSFESIPTYKSIKLKSSNAAL